jgi:hypothetical protein
MEIGPYSPGHPYRQLAGWLRSQIRRGEITAQLPSITTLTAQPGLAVGTVRRYRHPRPRALGADRTRLRDLRDAQLTLRLGDARPWAGRCWA